MIKIILPPYSFLNIKDDWVTKNAVLRWYARKKYRQVIKLAGDANEILDAGCGVGYLACNLASHFGKVVGIDINYFPELLDDKGKNNKSILDMAKFLADSNKLNNIQFIESNLIHTDLDDNRFDCIFCLEVFETLDSQEKVITELYRVLKPQGILILSIPNIAGFNILWRRMANLFLRLPVDYEDESVDHASLIQKLNKLFLLTEQSFFPFNFKYFSNSLIIKLQSRNK